MKGLALAPRRSPRCMQLAVQKPNCHLKPKSHLPTHNPPRHQAPNPFAEINATVLSRWMSFATFMHFGPV
jgi:hypothetical protein